MPIDPAAYRDFYYPLNVFMHILSHEESEVRYLHYGIFESADDSIATAQERSTDLLLSRLPPPPARLLDVGTGLGTTLARLRREGWDATGITPDAKQIAMIRARHGDALPVVCTRLEDFPATDGQSFDAILFQESSQYIESNALFAKAAELTSRVLILDELAAAPGGTLHSYATLVAAARANGFELAEEVDVSAKVPATIDYFLERIPRYRDRLVEELNLTGQQVDDLVDSGRTYRELYDRGAYVYRLLDLRR